MKASLSFKTYLNKNFSAFSGINFSIYLSYSIRDWRDFLIKILENLFETRPSILLNKSKFDKDSGNLILFTL